MLKKYSVFLLLTLQGHQSGYIKKRETCDTKYTMYKSNNLFLILCFPVFPAENSPLHTSAELSLASLLSNCLYCEWVKTTQMSLFHSNWSYLGKRESIVSIIAMSPALWRFFHEGSWRPFILPLITIFMPQILCNPWEGCLLGKYVFLHAGLMMFMIDFAAAEAFPNGRN